MRMPTVRAKPHGRLAPFRFPGFSRKCYRLLSLCAFNANLYTSDNLHYFAHAKQR